MLTKLKKKVQQLMLSEAKAANAMHLSPNAVTIVGFVLALFAGIMYAMTTVQQTFWLIAAVILLLASGFCDALDGVIARTYQKASVFGGFLDSTLDRYADTIVLAGIIICGVSPIITPTIRLISGLAAIISSFMVSYTRARAEAIGIKMESVGLAERAERMIILAFSTVAAMFWLPALEIGLVLIAVLSTFTVFQRGAHTLKVLRIRETVPH